MAKPTHRKVLRGMLKDLIDQATKNGMARAKNDTARVIATDERVNEAYKALKKVLDI
jgi:hypothetical protein